MSALERLFSPITIGTTEVKNRIAMAPMTSVDRSAATR